MDYKTSLTPMNVCVIGGSGYVGFVTGLGLSAIGHNVISVDVDHDRTAELNAGICHLHEQGAENLLGKSLSDGLIRFSTDLEQSVANCDIVIIAVGTPSLANGQADLSQIVQVSEKLSDCMTGYTLVVIKSTVPVGTVELVRSTLNRDQEESKDFDIVVNPEFLREGHGLYDFFYPDRIVVGSLYEKPAATMRSLYEQIIKREINWTADDGILDTEESKPSKTVPVIETDPTTAQMIKYSSNAFLASRISFINEIAGLCEKIGADVNQVSRGMGYDPRIGDSYLNPGPGFGGPCLEKDLKALLTVADETGYQPELLRAVLERNELQLQHIMSKLLCMSGGSLNKKTIAVFGLAFKAGTNDVRNSLAVKIVERLDKAGVNLRVHDPEAKIASLNSIQYDDPYLTTVQADMLLILTEWPVFKELDYRVIKNNMVSAKIFDARNILDSTYLRNIGFSYVGLGIL